MTAIDFNNLVIHESDFLKPYAISLTGDHEDAKDLYQETVMRALQNRDKYQLGSNPRGWLYIIMRNAFINNYRRNKRSLNVDEYGTLHTELQLYKMKHTAQNEGWSNMQIREIRQAIDALPAAIQQAFELHYRGYKYQEIADMLDAPLGTVKSRIYFARKILAAKLGGKAIK